MHVAPARCIRSESSPRAPPRASCRRQTVLTSPADARRPTRLDLARGFASLALRGFGGVGGQAQHYFTRERRWLTEAEFAETLAISQALPGANMGNVAVLVGDRFGGPLGAICAMAGFCLPSTVVAIVLAMLLAHIAAMPHVGALETGIVAGAAGLIVASGARIALRYRSSPFVLLAMTALVAAILFVRLPIPLVVIVSVPALVVLQRIRTTAAT